MELQIMTSMDPGNTSGYPVEQRGTESWKIAAKAKDTPTLLIQMARRQR